MKLVCTFDNHPGAREGIVEDSGTMPETSSLCRVDELFLPNPEESRETSDYYSDPSPEENDSTGTPDEGNGLTDPMEILTRRTIKVCKSLGRDDFVFKVLIVGDSCTGKTSFGRNYVTGKFNVGYKSTIGVDYYVKEMELNETVQVRLQLWDFSGDERARCLHRAYYRGAHGVFVLADVTRKDTFEGAISWKKEVDNKVVSPDGRQIPSILVVNKCDSFPQEKYCDSFAMSNFCRLNGFNEWLQTSAKNNVNLNEVGLHLLYKMLKRLESIYERIRHSNEFISLEVPRSEKKKICSC